MFNKAHTFSFFSSSFPNGKSKKVCGAFRVSESEFLVRKPNVCGQLYANVNRAFGPQKTNMLPRCSMPSRGVITVSLASVAGTVSNFNGKVAWHWPQSALSRVEEELMEKSARALASTTDPVEKLRLQCLSRGASGIMCLGRFLRNVDDECSKKLNKEEFFKRIKDTGLDVSDEDEEKLFKQFDIDNSGSIHVDEFIREIRPPMSDSRQKIVEQAFRKLDKSGDGVVDIEDLRSVYAVTASPRYMSGEETAEVVMNRFLANFETEGTVNGKVTLEEFMNYYSGISVSIDNDCYFDLMMRQAYKL